METTDKLIRKENNELARIFGCAVLMHNQIYAYSMHFAGKVKFNQKKTLSQIEELHEKIKRKSTILSEYEKVYDSAEEIDNFFKDWKPERVIYFSATILDFFLAKFKAYEFNVNFVNMFSKMLVLSKPFSEKFEIKEKQVADFLELLNEITQEFEMQLKY